MSVVTDLPSRRTSDAPPVGRRHIGRRVAAYPLGGVAALAGIGGLGLRIEPQPLPERGLKADPVATIPAPAGLPEQEDRSYRTLYGDDVPVIETPVAGGRGLVRVNGITPPARYRFSHVASHDDRHFVKVIWYGRRRLTVNDWALDGPARLELSFGVMEGPRIDQQANLAPWAEAGWFPSVPTVALALRARNLRA